MPSRNFTSYRFLSVAALTVSAAVSALSSRATERVREPAVAGLFYPKDPAELSRLIQSYLAAAKTDARGDLKALITPHAGYAYSGPVAAQAFRTLVGRSYKTVIVIGPSHYALVAAASVSGTGRYRTPLGEVPVSPKARELGKLRPFEIDARATVERPNWWRQSSRTEPTPSEENAETWEHSVEVEIPFLQQTLGRFSLVPVVMGDVDTAKAGKALARVIDDDTLIVASSDLSHYHPYAEARALDQRCVDAILKLDTESMAAQEACGKNPILTLLQVAKQRGWKPRLLDLRNSGDVAGDKSSVVGYTAIAFYAEAASVDPDTYSRDDGRQLLKLARDSVQAAVSHRSAPSIEGDALPAKLQVKRGTFVTLNERGELRGCIGHLGAMEPLYQDVIDNARAAALEDPRFPPVSVKEVEQLEIEVSVLTPPQPLTFTSPDDLLRKLQPHKDGVVLRIGDRTSTYLPQVWEMIEDKVQFLNTLSEKAGLPPQAWRGPGVSVEIYHVQSFHETQLGK